MKRLLLLLLPLALFSCSKAPDGVDSAGAPAVPHNLKCHNATDGSLTFQWGAVEGATSYEWKLTGEGSFLKEGTSAKRNVTVRCTTLPYVLKENFTTRPLTSAAVTTSP